MDIPSNFDNLSSKDQNKVTNLIQKLNNKANTEETTGKQERSVRRPPATQMKKISQQGTPAQKIGRQPKNVKQSTQPLRKKHNTVGTVDLSQPVDADDRTNRFLDLKGDRGGQLVDMHQQDIKIDQKLSGNNQVTERGDRQELIEARCNQCGTIWEVSHKLVNRDTDGIRFVCDDCQRGRS